MSAKKAKHFPLPKRFSAAMSEKAYARLRALNEQYGYGNNYLLTIIFENLDDIVDKKSLKSVFERYIAEYGAPATTTMRTTQKKT